MFVDHTMNQYTVQVGRMSSITAMIVVLGSLINKPYNYYCIKSAISPVRILG